MVVVRLIKLEENSKVFFTNQIYEYLDPSKIYIPILKKATFKMKDYIYKDTIFDLFTTSISGYVSGNKKILLNKKIIPALEITNDFKENINVKKIKRKVETKEELINCLNDFNLNVIASKILEKENITKLVISSIDEEVYSFKEFMILSSFHTEILETVHFIQKILNIKSAIIATKNTNAKSIKNVKSIIGTYPNLRITLTNNKYLISEPKYLCEYLNINLNNTLILTTKEIYDIYNAILKGKSILNNIITISGDAIEKSIVINTKLGVSLKELLDKFVNIISDDYEVYINGYLKGIKVENIEEVIITKDIDTIVINKKSKDIVEECINCGACKKVCPHKINVRYCYLNNLSSKKCIGCGLCNYICPARLKLKEIVMSDEDENKNN